LAPAREKAATILHHEECRTMFDCSVLRCRIAPALISAASALGLLAADPVTLAPPQTVIIFAFHTATGLPASAGSDFAVKLADAINRQGGVTASAAPADTAPAQYLKTALASNGDYYLTGYVTPVAQSVTVVEQLVSTRSGIAVWNTSEQVTTPDDLVSAADTTRRAILAYAGRGYLAMTETRPAPPPAAAPPARAKGPVQLGSGGGSSSGAASAGAPDAHLTPLPIPKGDVDNLGLGFPNGPQPTANPIVYATASNPQRFAIVTIGGRAIDAVRAYATTSMVGSLKQHGQTAALVNPDDAKHVLLRADDICALTGSTFLVVGALNTTSTDASAGESMWTDATLNVTTYDCTTKAFVTQPKPVTASSGSWRTAVSGAVTGAVNYLLKLPTVATTGKS
jgi:hypothetical protein